MVVDLAHDVGVERDDLPLELCIASALAHGEPDDQEDEDEPNKARKPEDNARRDLVVEERALRGAGTLGEGRRRRLGGRGHSLVLDDHSRSWRS